MKLILTALFILSIAGCQVCCDASGNSCAQRCTHEVE